MPEGDRATQSVRGHVKWFDPEKGFGFIVADGGGADILLHANVLRNFGQSSVADGSGIEVTLQETPRGLQAVQVLEIAPPELAPAPGLEDLSEAPVEEMLARPLEPARVKWFDKAKGFGFANVFGRPEDVFIHIEVLRHSGLSDLQAGEAVSLRVIEGRRGRMAVNVSSWEAGVRERLRETEAPRPAPDAPATPGASAAANALDAPKTPAAAETSDARGAAGSDAGAPAPGFAASSRPDAPEPVSSPPGADPGSAPGSPSSGNPAPDAASPAAPSPMAASAEDPSPTPAGPGDADPATTIGAARK